MQANTWQQITVAGNKPSGRYAHVAAWSDAADGLYIHGGSHGSSAGAQEVGRVGDQRLRGYLDDVWLFSRQAGFGDGAQAWTCREAFLGLAKTIRVIWAFVGRQRRSQCLSLSTGLPME